MTNIMESLQAEFPFEQLGWKITYTFESQGHFYAYIAPFVDARVIQDRFDEVLVLIDGKCPMKNRVRKQQNVPYRCCFGTNSSKFMYTN